MFLIVDFISKFNTLEIDKFNYIATKYNQERNNYKFKNIK